MSYQPYQKTPYYIPSNQSQSSRDILNRQVYPNHNTNRLSIKQLKTKFIFKNHITSLTLNNPYMRKCNPISLLQLVTQATLPLIIDTLKKSQHFKQKTKEISINIRTIY